MWQTSLMCSILSFLCFHSVSTTILVLTDHFNIVTWFVTQSCIIQMFLYLFAYHYIYYFVLVVL